MEALAQVQKTHNFGTGLINTLLQERAWKEVYRL